MKNKYNGWGMPWKDEDDNAELPLGVSIPDDKPSWKLDCTCGGESVYGKPTNLHANHCDLVGKVKVSDDQK